MAMRKFKTGATRDEDDEKYDYEGFLDPEVLEVFGEFMHTHRKQADGKLRDSDNWQKGIPLTAYMKSLVRHVITLWKLHRGKKVKPEKIGGKWVTPTKEQTCAAIMFNSMGYIHELLRKK